MVVSAQLNLGQGLQREIFFLNLEDGYFGCQVNESTEVLQLFEVSKLCDGIPNCFLASDENFNELKCTNNCPYTQGYKCTNGACLDGLCHCNDGYGGCGCESPDENECKYRPCDVFASCTNTLGSFYCTCFPGYEGDGFSCSVGFSPDEGVWSFRYDKTCPRPGVNSREMEGGVGGGASQDEASTNPHSLMEDVGLSLVEGTNSYHSHTLIGYG
ncbi:Protocadherin Fat 3-like [Homarus americanus]|uniref:Protocadherin Fat 3-like n=1 Tax=Homarus americanus TaxID=6706 RepID=A0A8J5JA08_HOMAM|nr:Protocadherin Fat 3-like [Homarus americanus]